MCTSTSVTDGASLVFDPGVHVVLTNSPSSISLGENWNAGIMNWSGRDNELVWTCQWDILCSHVLVFIISQIRTSAVPGVFRLHCLPTRLSTESTLSKWCASVHAMCQVLRSEEDTIIAILLKRAWMCKQWFTYQHAPESSTGTYPQLKFPLLNIVKTPVNTTNDQSAIRSERCEGFSGECCWAIRLKECCCFNVGLVHWLKGVREIAHL